MMTQARAALALALALVAGSTLAVFPAHANTCNPPRTEGPAWNVIVPTGCEIRIATPGEFSDRDLAELKVLVGETPVEVYVERLDQTITTTHQDLDCNNFPEFEREVVYRQIEIHPVDQWPAGAELRIQVKNSRISVDVAMDDEGVCAPELDPGDTYCQPPIQACFDIYGDGSAYDEAQYPGDEDSAYQGAGQEDSAYEGSGDEQHHEDVDAMGCNASSPAQVAWPLLFVCLGWFRRWSRIRR